MRTQPDKQTSSARQRDAEETFRDGRSRRASEAEKIVVRRMDFPFAGLPKHWFEDDPFLTHLVNGLHFVFPAGERFFIRSVRHYLGKISAERRAEVAAFCGQEAMHQREHLQAFEAIADQGFDVEGFLEWYQESAYRGFEPRTSPLMRLAATVALEHYTAVLGEFALESGVLENIDERMRDLLLWHAAEEIEHKSVAFDVLKEVDPSYALRIKGFVLATGLLGFYWSAGTWHLLRQEQPGSRLPTAFSIRRLAPLFSGRTLGRVLDYLRPNFHPDDHDNYALAHAYLKGIGRLEH